MWFEAGRRDREITGLRVVTTQSDRGYLIGQA